MNLMPVIEWLEHGGDPKEAVKELRIYQGKIREPKTVVEIVKSHLIAGGFGGLVKSGGECGCELNDLVPCGSDCSGCKAGYKHTDPRSEPTYVWAIWEQKEPPTLVQWATVDY